MPPRQHLDCIHPKGTRSQELLLIVRPKKLGSHNPCLTTCELLCHTVFPYCYFTLTASRILFFLSIFADDSLFSLELRDSVIRIVLHVQMNSQSRASYCFLTFMCEKHSFLEYSRIDSLAESILSILFLLQNRIDSHRIDSNIIDSILIKQNRFYFKATSSYRRNV